jgi:hypothetical protein
VGTYWSQAREICIIYSLRRFGLRNLIFGGNLQGVEDEVWEVNQLKKA